MTEIHDPAAVPMHRGTSAPGFPGEEIRFAVVLNGGVSLAVWMGGVVCEIDRVTRRTGVYGQLLKLLDTTARADVIAGTSAGGINGAVLAVSQANRNAKVDLLRDLWSDQGRMENLLQRPFRGSPASLLRGDDYFLPKLHDAIKRLSEDWDPTPRDERPVDLMITTTLLHGARTVSADSLGQQLPQRQHEGHFRFQRGDRATGIGGDDFDPNNDPHIGARLAIAARCTAGFPGAFEPCFVPAREKRLTDGTSTTPPMPAGDIELSNATRRPDLGRFVSWRTAGPADQIPPDRSRYLVDGGLLENTPTRTALEAISQMPAGGGLIQRVMLLVYPHAPTNETDPADQTYEPPTVAQGMSSLLGALLSQGSRTFVEEIEEYNRSAASRRGTRLDVLESVSQAQGLQHIAEVVYPHYQHLRIRRATRDLAKRFTPPTSWSYERIRRAVEDGQNAWLKGIGPLPYIPADPSNHPQQAAAHWKWGEEPPQRWPWGITAAIDITDAAMDLLRRLVGVIPNAEAADAVASARKTVTDAQTSLREVREQIDERWVDDETLAKLQPSTPFWKLRLAYYAKAMLGGHHKQVTDARSELEDYEFDSNLKPRFREDLSKEALDTALEKLSEHVGDGVQGAKAADAIKKVVKAVADALAPLSDIGVDTARLTGLGPWKQCLVGDPDSPSSENTLYTWLLRLHVATWIIADETPIETSFPIDLVQISLQTRNAFAKQSITADDKVGGMSLHRFGGFLKRSWRMNDWTWGRIDAATMLCQIILSPARLRRHAIRNERLTKSEAEAKRAARDFVEDLVSKLFSDSIPDEMRENSVPDEMHKLIDEAAGELTPVYRSEKGPGELPPSLPKLASIAAWAIHMRVAVEELPVIAAAVKADRYDRANRSSRGELFVDQYEQLLRTLSDAHPANDGPLSPDQADNGRQALEALDQAGIGREPLAEEARGDQMIRTAATAASVAVTVADSPRSGLTAVKPVTRALRGGMLLPYWTVMGLASGGTVARFLALWILASGAVLVALPLLGVLHGWAAAPATAIGVAAILTAFGVAAVRTGTLLHSIVLLTPVIPLVVFAAQGWYERENGGSGTSAQQAADAQHVGLGTLLTILALTLALMLLGSLPADLGTPVATLYHGLDRIADRYYPNSQQSKLAGRFKAFGIWLRSRPVLLTVGALLAAIVALLYGRDVMDSVAGWAESAVIDLSNLEHTVLVVAAIILVAASWLLGYWAGWRLRPWVKYPDGWRTRPVAHPAGTAATWSVIYGTVFSAAAVWMIWNWPTEPGWAWWAALATAVTFAAILLYALPLVTAVTSIRRVGQRLIDEVQQGGLCWPAPPHHKRGQTQQVGVESAVLQHKIITVLVSRDFAVRCLIEGHDRLHGRGRVYNRVRLRRKGRRLARRVTKKTASLRSPMSGAGPPSVRGSLH
jgi:patatin-related protein